MFINSPGGYWGLYIIRFGDQSYEMHLFNKCSLSTCHVPGSEGHSEMEKTQSWCLGSSWPGGQDNQGTGSDDNGAIRKEHRSRATAAV